MSKTLNVTSLLDLMPMPNHTRLTLDAQTLLKLDQGIEEFLQTHDALPLAGAEMLAGSIHIETNALVLETLVFGAEILTHAAEPSSFITALPSVCAWLVALYQHCDRLDRKNGELCVYKMLLLNEKRDIHVSSIVKSMPCRTGSIDAECGFARKNRCRINESDVLKALKSLGVKNLAFSTGSETWQGRA
jgi:hypothetical protein